MNNVCKVLILSTISSVMYSCSSRDVDAINLPDNLQQKGELQVNVKSDDASSTSKPNIDSEDGIENLHFFVFKQGCDRSNNWYKEDYQKKEFSVVSDNKLAESIEGGNSKASDYFSSKLTIGIKRLAIVANCNSILGVEGSDKTDGNIVTDIIDLHTSKVNLSTQSIGNFTMVGEREFHVNKGLNETTVSLTRLVAKVVLKSIAISKEYQDKITVNRAFMMNVNGESFLQGTGEDRNVEFNNPVTHGYDASAEGIYNTDLSQQIGTMPSAFYVFENKGTTAKTMLVIQAAYKKKNGTTVPVYYSIVVKTNGVEELLRNNVYTLSATIKRPGSLTPEEPTESGDLEVNISVDPWKTNKDQEESFD